MLTEREIVIEPRKSAGSFIAELWQYRDLFFYLAWRDLLVRYKQTILGIAWSILRPLLTMIIFTIVFGKIAKLPSGEVPYPVLVFAAMIPWQLFSNTFSEAASSLIANQSLISKVYFPRIIIPSTAMVVGLVDFLISIVILAVLMLWFGVFPDIKILFLPLLLLIAMLTSLGCGFFIAALNVKYRDFRYIVPFLVQLGLYISPVGFSSSVVPEKWRFLYSLNPMVGVIDGFRWGLLGQHVDIYWEGFGLSIFLAATLFCGGAFFFIKSERAFADII